MNALVLQPDNRLALVDHDTPRLHSPDDVLVRVVGTGICGTDRSILVGKFKARAGTVLGHESVGVVEAVGAGVSSLKAGEWVIVNPTFYCGECSACLAGRLNFCARKAGNEVGVDRDGGFAEYIKLPARLLHPVPAGMDLERAVMVEPLACALNNLEAARLAAGEVLRVVGGGPIGVVTAMLALAMGAEVSLVEVDPCRRELCARFLSGHPGARVLAPEDSTACIPADVAVDTVGDRLVDALASVRPGGRVVVMGYNSHAELPFRPLDIVLRGVSVMGAGDYHAHTFPRAVRIASRLPLERLVTARYAIEDHQAAFACLASRRGEPYRAMKVLISPSAGPGAHAGT